MKRALLVNAYAIGNWGDAAIVEGLISSLRQSGFGHVTVAPVDWREGASAWMMLGADDVVRPLVSLLDGPSVKRFRRAARGPVVAARLLRFASGRGLDRGMAAYRQADLVVSVGGAYLGGTKVGANLLKAANVRAGRFRRRPTLVAPVTVNPSSASVLKVLRWGLEGSTVFVRDRPSLDVIRRAGLEATIVPDLAFRAPSLVTPRASIRDRTGVGFGTIGWAPRGYRKEHDTWGNPSLAETHTLAAVRNLLQTSDDRLVFIPHVRAASDDDMEAVERLAAELSPADRKRVDVLARPSTLRDAVAQYALVDVLISSRMHAAIFAMAVGTPAVAIGYEPKVAGVFGDLGLGDRVVPSDEPPTPDEIAQLVRRMRAEEERKRTTSAFTRAVTQFGSLDAAFAEILRH